MATVTVSGAYASTTSGASVSDSTMVLRLKLKSSITTKGIYIMREIPFAHPGEILNEDFLKPLGISQYALAKAIGVPPRRINEIVQGKRGISADTALRLAAFFGTDAQSWINLQSHYDEEQAKETLADVLARIKPHQAKTAVN